MKGCGVPYEKMLVSHSSKPRLDLPSKSRKQTSGQTNQQRSKDVEDLIVACPVQPMSFFIKQKEFWEPSLKAKLDLISVFLYRTEIKRLIVSWD